jgi:predicted hydrocarbon binding protein
MLNQIKSFLKIKLENNSFPLRLVALVEELKSPTKTVLDSFSFDKAILIFMNYIKSNNLQPIRQQFGNQLGRSTHERNWFEIIHLLKIIFFRN